MKTPLNLPVPPMFERALGYEGDARYVAFDWMPGGDELMYHDGTVSADGDYNPWLLWTRHITTAAVLAGYHFGNSDEPAQHWLLLDREERRFYVIPARDGERFFAELPEAVEERRRWEALSPEERERLQREAWARFQEAFKEIPKPSMEDIHQRIEESHRRYLELAQWLDEQQASCPACHHLAPAKVWEANSLNCIACGANYWLALVTRERELN
jgi:hypothetical protein